MERYLGLIGLAYTGLVWVAYKYPDAFRRLAAALAILAFAGFIAGVGYNAGVQDGGIAMLDMDKHSVQETFDKLQAIMVSSWVLFLAIPGFIGSLVFLINLHAVLGISQKEEVKGGEE